MVKFLKLPVLFKRVIYLMNKASPSISTPPSAYPPLLSQEHALTPRLSTISVCCVQVSHDSHTHFHTFF